MWKQKQCDNVGYKNMAQFEHADPTNPTKHSTNGQRPANKRFQNFKGFMSFHSQLVPENSHDQELL